MIGNVNPLTLSRRHLFEKLSDILRSDSLFIIGELLQVFLQ